jgi:hypothetical protein
MDMLFDDHDPLFFQYPHFLFGTGVRVKEEDDKSKLVKDILDYFIQSFPEASIVAYFQARREQLEGNVEKSNELYQLAMNRQTQMVSAHQAAKWERMFNCCLLIDTKEGMRLAELLLKESNWSKCTYCYFKAILLYTRGTAQYFLERNYCIYKNFGKLLWSAAYQP